MIKTFTIKDIRSWKPCYDPAKVLPEGWSGTTIDILKNDKIPHNDKLWVVLRDGLISEKTLRLFAVWCARQVQHLMTDPSSIAALDIAERHANGQATDEELGVTRTTAWVAASAAASAAASYAAWNAASYAASAAARDAEKAQRDKLIEMILAE